jgi:hypothetical protein
VSPSPTATSSYKCELGGIDFNQDGTISPDECGDPQPSNMIYVPEDQSDFCAGSLVKVTYYYWHSYISGGWLDTLEEYQALQDGLDSKQLDAPFHDIYLSTDGGSVYNRIEHDFDPMPGATMSSLPNPLKSGATSSDKQFLKVTHYVKIPDNMISDPSKAKILVYVGNGRNWAPTPDDGNLYIPAGGYDYGAQFVYTPSNPSPEGGLSGDVGDFTNAVQSKQCTPGDLISPSPIPSPVSQCLYNFTTPKPGQTLPTQKIFDISWASNSPLSQPKANLYLSTNNGSTYKSIASDLTTPSYSHYFSNNDSASRAKLRLDHLDQSGKIISSCYSGVFRIAGSGGIGGASGSSTTTNAVNTLLILGSLLSSVLSFLLTGIASLPFLQRLSNSLFAIFAPPAWAGKQPSWGLVYDSISKKPLKDVVLRVFAEPSGRLKSSIKSNINGAFGFILPPGRYSLIASLMGYEFPSKLIIGNTDGKFLSVYKGGNLDVAGDGQQKAQVDINVPLDRATMTTLDVIQVRTLATISRFFQTIRLPFMIIGTIAAGYLLFKDHRIIDYVIGILYVVLWAVEIKNMLKKKAYGMVRDTAGNPVSMALIRAIDQRGRLKFTSATGDDGKFQLFLDPGVYRLDVSRGGYRNIRTELFKIDKIQDIGRLDLRLQKL